MRLLTLSFCLLALIGNSQVDSVALKYGNTITSAELKTNLDIIASDAYEGRETGRKGQKMAAEYIANAFKSYGIPAYNGTYLQPYPIHITHPGGVTLKVGEHEAVWKKDFYHTGGFDNQLIETDEFIFVGYGIEHEKYSDYKDLDVTGKVLVMMASEPFDKKNNGLISGEHKFSEWVNHRKKQALAQQKGAKALIIITKVFDKYIDRYSKYLEHEKTSLADTAFIKPGTIPTVFVSKSYGDRILKSAKIKFDKVEKKITCKKKTIRKTVDLPVVFNVNRTIENLEAENVVGYIEGSDLKDELIVISAHYDHIGVEGDVVFNGADDDGSGTVGIMEIAQAFQKAKSAGHGPRRSVLILPVSGEEKGLLGSDYYTTYPLFPLEKTVANLNIDMIGRLDTLHDDPNYVYIIGSTMLSTELHEASVAANDNYTKIDLDYRYNTKEDPNRYYYRSDHYNFAKHRVPCIFYFNGTHADYHKATDTVDKIDYDKVEHITRLVFYTAWDIVNRDKRLVVDGE